MRIAIIGAGFSGLATAYWLTRNPQLEVQLFDQAPIAAGTSGLAAGLLHPYRSSSFLLNWNADECMQETVFLLQEASTILKTPCYKESGILRPLTHEKEWEISETEAVAFWPAEKTARVPHLLPLTSAYLQRGITVDCPRYLEGLFALCTIRGMTFEIRKIASLKELTGFDRIVVTTGAGYASIEETKHLPLVPIKGQLIELELPSEEILPFPVFAKAYLITKEKTCIVGATFERKFQSEREERAFAEKDLRKKVAAFTDYYGDLPLISCKAGMRATTKDHRPLLAEFQPHCYCLTGMGSRGLLYHAAMAKKLALTVVR